MSFWKRYETFYLDHFASVSRSYDEGLPYLRDKLFVSIMLITLPIGIVIYIPSVIVSLITNQSMIAVFDTLALLVVLIAFFNRKISIGAKKILFSTTFYILSIILLIYLGTQGPGILILIFISVLITLLHSKRAGLISIGLNATIFSLLFVPFFTETIHINFVNNQLPVGWIAIGINLVAFNAMIVLSVSFLVDQLNESLRKEKKLQELLKEESLGLLQAKQKAEENERLKSAFLANMSHEVRTPLNSIIGFSELLTDPEFQDEKQKKEFLQQIITNGNNLLSIINDILDISKIESGELKIYKNEIQVGQFISGIRERFVFQAKEKNVDLRLTLPKIADETKIVADSNRLHQIFNNLISNALKFTSHGSIEIGYRVARPMIEFFVKDTGIGILPEFHEKIFERFRQVELEKTRKFGGNGLGLAITKNLVEMMGGKIWIESEFGTGSAFYFTLPASPNKQPIVQNG